MFASTRITVALALAASAVAGQAATSIPLANGSFEDGFTSGNATSGTGIWVKPNSWSLLTPGGEARSGWRETRATPPSPLSPDGGGFWSLEYVTGWTTGDVPGGTARFNAKGISQTISGLKIGDRYEISFYSMANAPDPTSENGLAEYWSVSFGPGAAQNGAKVYSNDHTTWKQSTLSFTATQPSQLLSFVGVWLNATPGATPTYLNLDGIKINDLTPPVPVPEPATVSLTLAGLVALGLLTRRRRAGKSMD